MKTRSAEPNVRENHVALEEIGGHQAAEDLRCDRREPPYFQWPRGHARERFRELLHLNRIAVHEEIAAPGLSAFSEVHECARAVMNVNWRDPIPVRAKL